jgi:Fe-S cluster assembly iron-binding protein IscA
MPLVTLEPGVGQAIRSSLAEVGVHGPVRIEVQFSGCCDPSLGLMVDKVRESDLVEEVDAVTFVISPETHELAGEVRISHVDEGGGEGFVLTSSRPMGEWDGFSPCRIRM